MCGQPRGYNLANLAGFHSGFRDGPNRDDSRSCERGPMNAKTRIFKLLVVAAIIGPASLAAEPAKNSLYVNSRPGYQELSQMVRVPASCAGEAGCHYLAGTVREGEHGYSKALLVKLDGENRELWSLSLGTADNFGIIDSLAVEKDGSIIVAGGGSLEFAPSKPGQAAQGIELWRGGQRLPTITALSLGTNFAKRYWVARISSQGQVLAAKSFDEPKIPQNADPKRADSEPSLAVRQVLLEPSGEFWLVGDVSGRWVGSEALTTLSQGKSDLYCMKFSAQLEPLERRQWGRQAFLKADVVRWTAPGKLSIFGRELQPGKNRQDDMGPSPSQPCQWTWDLSRPRQLPAQISESKIGKVAVNAKVLDFCQIGPQQLLLREGKDAEILLDRRSDSSAGWTLWSKLPFSANAMAADDQGVWLVGFGSLKGTRAMGGCDISLAHMNWQGQIGHPHVVGSSERDFATSVDLDPLSHQLWVGATSNGALEGRPAPTDRQAKLVVLAADLADLTNGPLTQLGEEPPGPIRFKSLPEGAKFWSEERPGFDHVIGLYSAAAQPQQQVRLIGTREVPRRVVGKSHQQDTPFVAELSDLGATDVWEHPLAPAPPGGLEPLISLSFACWPDFSLLLSCREFQAQTRGYLQGITLFRLSPKPQGQAPGIERLKLPNHASPAGLSASSVKNQAFLVGQLANQGQLWRLTDTGRLLQSWPVKGYPRLVEAQHPLGIAVVGYDSFSSNSENWLEIRLPDGQLKHRLPLGKLRVSSLVCNESGPLLYGNIEDHLGLAQFVWEGRMAWSRRFGAKGRQMATRIRPAAKGGYWLCGSTTEAFPGCTAWGAFDGLLLGVDSFGQQQSARQFGTRYSEFLIDVLETPEHLWLAGEIESSDLSTDLWTLKLPR